VSIWDNPDNFVNKERGFPITLNLGKSVNSTVLKLSSLNPNNCDHNPSYYEILQLFCFVGVIFRKYLALGAAIEYGGEFEEPL
jgi:hypothetical protein